MPWVLENIFLGNLSLNFLLPNAGTKHGGFPSTPRLSCTMAATSVIPRVATSTRRLSWRPLLPRILLEPSGLRAPLRGGLVAFIVWRACRTAMSSWQEPMALASTTHTDRTSALSLQAQKWLMLQPVFENIYPILYLFMSAVDSLPAVWFCDFIHTSIR